MALNQRGKFMAKGDGTVENSSEEGIWGTWEELLLAFAVNRYGTNSWDSVSVELQKRSSAPAPLLSPHHCKLRYLDLKRRYSETHNGNGNGNGNVNDDDEKTTECCFPLLLEELRKLRVAELKRELEIYDLSILSLELKKQQLEEERERNENGESKPEEEKCSSEDASESSFTDLPVRTGSLKTEPERTGSVKDEPDKCAEAKPVREDSLCSAERKQISRLRTGAEDDEKMTEPVRTGSVKEEPEEKPVREDSYNGSSDSVEKPPVDVSMKVEPLEMVAESKENSDVQSCASEKVNDKVIRRCNCGEKDNQSPTVKETPVESQPLIAFLDKIRGHELGSLFERRLESQETENYSNLVRQHVDLETVQTWLENGRYLSCKSKFFRDLLLLASNAIVFFNKSSSQFVAATELRHLILKEISLAKSKSDSSSGKQTSLNSGSWSKNEIAKPSDYLLLKTNISGSMIVCRKRSSIAAKASASSSVGDKRREQTIPRPAEKVIVGTFQQSTEPATNAENRITKKGRQDRFASGSASLKKNEKSRSNTTSIKISAAVVDKNQGKGESSSQQQQSKVDNRNQQSNTDVKKRSATNFLNRMKQSSSSSLLLDALKSTPLSSDSKGGSEQKKKGSGAGGGRKKPASTKNTEAKQAKEKGSQMKKNLGRPPKRGADPSPPSTKRSREGAESSAITQKQPRKRSRR